MGLILTIYPKTTLTIITKLLRWYHRVVHNFPAKFQSCKFNGLGGVASLRNTNILCNEKNVFFNLLLTCIIQNKDNSVSAISIHKSMQFYINILIRLCYVKLSFTLQTTNSIIIYLSSATP